MNKSTLWTVLAVLLLALLVVKQVSLEHASEVVVPAREFAVARASDRQVPPDTTSDAVALAQLLVLLGSAGSNPPMIMPPGK